MPCRVKPVLAGYIEASIGIAGAVISFLIDPDDFKLKYAISLAVVPILVIGFSSYLVIPIFVFSIISGTYLYTKKFYYPFVFLFAFTLLSYIFFGDGSQWMAIDAAISTGMIVVMIFDSRERQYVKANEITRGEDRIKEVRRDYVQIAAGIIIIGLLYFYGVDISRILVTFGSLLLYAIGNFFSARPDLMIGKFLQNLERSHTKLGIGSMWFASGILLAYSMHDGLYLIMLIVFIISIGDSIATIVGVNVKSPKLFINRKKSVAGTLSLFAVSAAFGFLLIGFLGIDYAALGSIVEAVSGYPLDDNMTVPFAISLMASIVRML
ncbi:diacylglycerol/polyprenol kinase family protein [Thermoplasma acidophilum]|uniref:diacylglycerol/polyprenol kinase family protein n=1 Tax=Thermoplasma acidophilum TaxID=2303 RepID=UPI001F51A647|nr:diacylglycerol/polyprenol kinase family protein [Thermoplasma acidophilum]